jgi:hypothetical protein
MWRRAGRNREALLAADEVRELHGVAQEEDRGVVADQVVVALGRVELQREAAHVAPRVGGARSPATVENRASILVSVPGWNTAALV